MEKEGERQEGSSISAGAAVGWMHGRATIAGRRWETGVISEFQYYWQPLNSLTNGIGLRTHGSGILASKTEL